MMEGKICATCAEMKLFPQDTGREWKCSLYHKDAPIGEDLRKDGCDLGHTTPDKDVCGDCFDYDDGYCDFEDLAVLPTEVACDWFEEKDE